MRWLLPLIPIVLGFGGQVVPRTPASLYIVSLSFSNFGPAFYYRVIELSPDGADSIVRYTRVANVNLYCPRMVVHSTEARLRGIALRTIVQGPNPCGVRPSRLGALLREYHQKASTFETISFGIVARCGGATVKLGLPIMESLDFDGLKRAHPEVAALWDLAETIDTKAFGAKDIFATSTPEDDHKLQIAGQAIVAELISGKYDAGLAVAAHGNVGRWRHPTFRDVLDNYKGPVSTAEARTDYIPTLLRSGAYRFAQYVAPKYPPLAKAARIEGKVTLDLARDPATGNVLSAKPIAGHPVLVPSAVDAAKQ